MSDTADTLRDLRRRIITVAAASGEGHVPSSLSVLPILWLLYSEVMGEQDKFVLSKGHAALGLYAVLEARETGRRLPAVLSDALTLDHFCVTGSPMYGHPDVRVPGVECSTGSLGHGFPMAVGMAYAKRLQGDPGRVYCLIGDGEAMEGSIWEAAQIAANLKLSNLVCIVDDNGTHAAGNLVAKFAAFGWDADRVIAHNSADMKRAMQPSPAGRPVCVVANTVKGDGCRPMEDDPGYWHHRVPGSPEGLAAMLEACE